MDASVDLAWPVVSERELDAALALVHYTREAWANAILYLEVGTGRRVAYVLNNGEHHLHPGLVEGGGGQKCKHARSAPPKNDGES